MVDKEDPNCYPRLRFDVLGVGLRQMLAAARVVSLVLLMVACSSNSGGRKVDEASIAKSTYHFQLASNYFHNKQIPQALKEIETSLSHNPRNKDALYLRGFIYFGRRHYPDAILDFTRVLEIDAKYYDARNNLGSAYIATGQYDLAIKALIPLTTERLYAFPYLAHNNLGWAYHQKRQFTQALEHYRLAVTLNSKFCKGYFNMGLLYRDTNQPNRAIKAFLAALRKCTNYVEPHYYLGVLFAQAGETDAALKHFERCIASAQHTALADKCKRQKKMLQR